MAMVSIILPTFNRSGFLPQAFQSIASQSYPDWELIVVDDGSNDDTRECVEALKSTVSCPVRYVYRVNGGPAEARNTGIDLAKGSYVAFFDSDDQWLPHHLAECVQALKANSGVDWVYAAGRRVMFNTGQTLIENSFYPNDTPQPFLSLNTRVSGPLRIIDDRDAVLMQIRHGLYCGLQNSVMRREMFDDLQLPSFRIGEDRLFTLMALVSGRRIGYLTNVHVIYHEHADNSSASGTDQSATKQVRVQEELIRCYEFALHHLKLRGQEVRALRVGLSREYFWHYGYNLLWQEKSTREAFKAFRRALALNPFDWRYWKTYLSCSLQSMIGARSL